MVGADRLLNVVFVVFDFFGECSAVEGNDAFMENGAVSIDDTDVVFQIAEVNANECCERLRRI